MRDFTLRRMAAVRLAALAAGLAVALTGCQKTRTTPDGGGGLQTWSVSGRVTGDVTLGVTIRVVGTALAVTTASDGTYSIGGLADGSYTLEAVRAGYGFTPPTRAVTVAGADVTGQDFASFLGNAISGTVAGPVVGGVTVTLTGPAPATTTLTAVTDASGGYVFVDVADGTYTVTPSLAGGWTFSPANSAVTVAGIGVNGPHFTSIPPVHAISGQITGAVTSYVTVTLSGAGADVVGVTDASGNYTFAGLAPGSYTVTPSRTGFAFSPSSLDVTVAAADVTGQDFVAAAVHRIAGWVTGDVLEGVTVTLTQASAVVGSATTDATGYFQVTGLVSGTYDVTPSLAGFTFSPASRTVTLAAVDVTNATFSATGGAVHSVSGAVTGPVQAGVTLTLQGATTVVATSGVGGTFTLTGVPDGDYMLVPSIDDYVFDPASRVVQVRGADVTGQAFASSLDPSARTIAGTVSGAVVSGVTLTLVGVLPVSPAVTVTTDADGAFAFRHLVDGLYSVTPSQGGYAFFPSDCLVTIDGPSVTYVAFSASSVPHTIAGRVSGAVAAGVTITLAGAFGAVMTTAADGSWAFVGLPDGDYTVTPSRAGYVFGPEAAAVTLAGADATGVNFVSAATHRIAGTVTGATGVTLTLSGAAAGEVTSDPATGYFEFPNLPDGTYLVTPSLAGYTFAPQSRSIPLAGADVTNATFTATLIPTYSVSGTVTGAASVTVTLSGAATDATTTDGSGNYVFNGLLDGSYMVIPMGATFTPASRAFRIDGANVTGQNFTSP